MQLLSAIVFSNHSNMKTKYNQRFIYFECMPNNQLVSRALEMLTKMYSCRRANES